ncbi:MAG TPA: hypothetical protein VFI33_15145 [Puia sp.]|nr:hypothetical protein [Puia sp.]
MKNINPRRMVPGIVLFIYIIAGCSKSSASKNNCNFSTGYVTAPSGAEVTYYATGKGSATLSSVTFQGVNGQETVSNPALPWSISFGYTNGGPVELSAEGTASNGGVLTLSYGINAGGTFNADTVACSH